MHISLEKNICPVYFFGKDLLYPTYLHTFVENIIQWTMCLCVFVVVILLNTNFSSGMMKKIIPFMYNLTYQRIGISLGGFGTDCGMPLDTRVVLAHGMNFYSTPMT